MFYKYRPKLFQIISTFNENEKMRRQPTDGLPAETAVRL